MSNFWHSRGRRISPSAFSIHGDIAGTIDSFGARSSSSAAPGSTTACTTSCSSSMGSSLSSAVATSAINTFRSTPNRNLPTMTCSRLERPSMDWRAPSIAIGTASLPYRHKLWRAGANFTDKLQAGEPRAAILSGGSPLVWARAEVACDSPDKKRVAEGVRIGSLMYEPVANAIGQTQSELTLVTPYLVPTPGELKLLEDRLIQHRRVRILTNSLESAPDLAAQAGYMHYRVPLLRQGAQLFEVRARLDSVRG